MNNQPTIKDVARLAGVSIGTVDRVLHNRGRVSAANQAAVEKAVESLRYRPSQVARALSIRRQNLSIGVSCPFVEQDFWTEACRGIQHVSEQLQKFGIEVIVDKYSSYELEAQRKSIERLLSQNVHGLVMTPVRNSDGMLDQLIPQDIPFCTVIDDCPKSRRLFHVGPNDYAMGQMMANLSILYRHDNLKVAVIAPNANMEGTSLRVSGFQDKLIEEHYNSALLTMQEIEGQTEKLSYDNIYDKTLELIQSYPELNAIYITNGLTQWAAAAVIAAGKQSDIYVFGHEYTSMTIDFVTSGPIIASIYQKPASQWDMAIQLLYEYIIGERPAPGPIINTECSIITKEMLPLLQLSQV